MTSIACLGPAQTFSELAAREYARSVGGGAQAVLYPSIKRAFQAVGRECELGVLPIENMLDGYVQQVLDLLLQSELVIVDEFILPVEFAFVATCPKARDVKRIYAQFVTQGQCAEFLDTMPHAEIVTTQSNGGSLDEVRRGRPNEGALVPRFAVEPGGFPLVVDAVSDHANNRTRFIAVARAEAAYDAATPYKTSLVVVEGMDRPGMLADILSAFATRDINVVSIMSRPTKETLGKYHFFMDIEGHARAPHIEDALVEIRRHNFVRLLGSYPRARAAP